MAGAASKDPSRPLVQKGLHWWLVSDLLDGSIVDSLQVDVVAIRVVTPVCERLHMDHSTDAEGTAMAMDAEDPFDYGADAVPDAEGAAVLFTELDRLTLRAEQLTAARKRAETQLQKCKQAEEQLLHRDIPELLAKMRLNDCTTASGIHVRVKREIKAALPGHDRVEARMGALRWLIDQGHGGVIKNQVTVTLDRGQDTRADELVVELSTKGFSVEAKKDVHAQTLGALVRELVAEGKVVPRDLFNLFDLRIAKLSRE